MKRSKFLKSSALGLAALSSLSFRDAPNEGSKKEEILQKDLGFNHLPLEQNITMENSILIKADSRGKADHGWLQANHSFSFANYYHPDRMNFGVIRVLNDDYIAGGNGFGTHPHENMEIITIPFEGDLEHKDSMGHKKVIRNGDVQVMSAGTGVYHSEYNAHKEKPIKLFQIWLFPNKQNVSPRYDQISLDFSKMKDQFLQILSPNPEDAGVWIHQNAWFDLGDFSAGKRIQHTLRASATNGVFAMVVEGDFKINGQLLNKRDGLGIWNIENLDIETISAGRLLLMEVPMDLSA
jgi:redox-sensitive bicupin YhaK (pirin superfamily)